MNTEAGRSLCLNYSPSLRSPKVSTASKSLKQALPKVSRYCNSQISREHSLPLKINSSFWKVGKAHHSPGPWVPCTFQMCFLHGCKCVWEPRFYILLRTSKCFPKCGHCVVMAADPSWYAVSKKANDFNVEFWLHTGAEPFRNSGFIKPIHNHEHGSLCKYPRYFWTSQFPFPINSYLSHLITYSQPLSRDIFLMLTPS